MYALAKGHAHEGAGREEETMSNAFFSLERPLAPRLIQYLYCIALALIAVLTVAGVAQGVRLMVRPAPPPISAAAPAPNGAPDTGAAPVPPPAGMRGRRFAMGPGGRPGMGPGPRRLRGPMVLRGMPPAVRGGAIIILVLLRALVAWMVIRILAEMGAVILKLRPASL
jgi:hypothetical protein